MMEQSMWALPIAGTGIELRRERTLEPHLERDTFSGGFNEDARIRNLDRLNRAKICMLRLPRAQWSTWPTSTEYDELILAPEHVIAKLAIEADGVVRLRRHHPATMQWIRQAMQMRAADRSHEQ